MRNLDSGQAAAAHERLATDVVRFGDAQQIDRAGCFFGTLEAFEAAVAKTHGDSRYGKVYRAAVAMIRATWQDVAP